MSIKPTYADQLEKDLAPYLTAEPTVGLQEKNTNILNRNTDKTEESPFPIDVFDGTIVEDLSRECARVFKIPESMGAMTALAVLSAACGKHIQIHAAYAKPSYPNIYVMIAAKSGTGKSVAFDQLAKPIVQTSAKMEKKHEESRTEDLTRADILSDKYRDLKRKIKSLETPKGEPSPEYDALLNDLIEIKGEIEDLENRQSLVLYTQNSTSEALVRLIKANNGNMSLLSAEAGEILKVIMGKYTKGNTSDIDVLLDSWSSSPLQYDRIGRERISLESSTLSLLFMVQPYVLEDFLSHRENLDRGLFARILSFDSHAELEHEEEDQITFPTDLEEKWNELIRNVLEEREKTLESPVPIQCSKEAREAFRLFHNETVDMRNQEYSDVSAELARWRENAIRVSLLLWLLDGDNKAEVSRDHAERAIKLVKWCGHEQVNQMSYLRLRRKEDRDGRLIDIIRAEGKIQTSRLAKNHNVPIGEINQLADSTPGLNIWSQKGDTGRPTKWIGFREPENGGRSTIS